MAPRSRPFPLDAADLRGLARLGVDAVVGVTSIVESMHHAIATRPRIAKPAASGSTTGITGFVYRAVRGTTRFVGRRLDGALTALPRSAGRPPRPEREALVAALNGVWGDHLAATGNPLAIETTLRIDGQPQATHAMAQAADPGGRLLVLVHGLAMNDLQWTRNGHNHGHALARDLGFTPLFLHYNSGRHVSQNGREFADRLDRLVAQWPVPVDELVIVAHSMGGLVTRSACHLGAGQCWMKALTKVVFLGTPHHGAPLERGGRLIDAALGASPYAAPLARLGRSRSAGITDLRFGKVQDADWQRAGGQTRDDRQPTPLPRDVECYLVAATTAKTASGLRSGVLGDGLVPLASALGQHRDPALALDVPAHRQSIVTSANHWDLLDRADVYAQLRNWLAPRAPAVTSSGS